MKNSLVDADCVTDPLPSAALSTVSNLRWVLKNCTSPSDDLISIHQALDFGNKRANMIVRVLQSRSQDSEAQMYLEELRMSNAQSTQMVSH
jgi:hypothetical protein